MGSSEMFEENAQSACAHRGACGGEVAPESESAMTSVRHALTQYVEYNRGCFGQCSLKHEDVATILRVAFSQLTYHEFAGTFWTRRDAEKYAQSASLFTCSFRQSFAWEQITRAHHSCALHSSIKFHSSMSMRHVSVSILASGLSWPELCNIAHVATIFIALRVGCCERNSKPLIHSSRSLTCKRARGIRAQLDGACLSAALAGCA